jgi:transketolase
MRQVNYRYSAPTNYFRGGLVYLMITNYGFWKSEIGWAVEANMHLTSELLLKARLRLLKMHYESGVGHIGGNLSCLDMLMALYHNVLGQHDGFVLSKGHSVGALYVTLWSLGLLSDDDLKTFHKDGTRLSGHPPVHGIPAIPFATGSLGHGLSLAAGLALGKRLKGTKGRLFCLTSDGEWNEGSNWESLIFTRHHRLNLTLIVDLNGLQGFGRTRDIADLEPLADKFRAFRLPTIEVNGHDLDAVTAALLQAGDGPQAVVAKTRKGHGVSAIENLVESHYLPLSQESYQQAVEQLTNLCATHSAALS